MARDHSRGRKRNGQRWTGLGSQNSRKLEVIVPDTRKITIIAKATCSFKLLAIVRRQSLSLRWEILLAESLLASRALRTVFDHSRVDTTIALSPFVHSHTRYSYLISHLILT